MKQNNQLEIKPPNISEKTLREMALFFRKTSRPRMIADMKKEEIKE